MSALIAHSTVHHSDGTATTPPAGLDRSVVTMVVLMAIAGVIGVVAAVVGAAVLVIGAGLTTALLALALPVTIFSNLSD